jgi:hypothetical protein
MTPENLVKLLAAGGSITRFSDAAKVSLWAVDAFK